MIGQIKTALDQSGIEAYRIAESVQESLECFFIRKRLDQKRRTYLIDYSVTVFRPFEKDGQKMLGSSTVNIHPGMEEKEMLDILQGAYSAAALVCNPYYELTRGKKEEMAPAKGRFAGQDLEESTRQMVEALYAADTAEEVFINSAEVFAKRVVKRIVNSRGVDVSYETCQVSGEYVVQCPKPQDVETYHQFAYRDAQTEELRRQVEEALSMTPARAKAVKAPKAGEYTVILSGRQVREVLSYYLVRSQTGMVYQKYSNYEIGAPIQGQEISGDAVTIELKAK